MFLNQPNGFSQRPPQSTQLFLGLEKLHPLEGFHVEKERSVLSKRSGVVLVCANESLSVGPGVKELPDAALPGHSGREISQPAWLAVIGG